MTEDEMRRVFGITPKQQREYEEWRRKEERKELALNVLRTLVIIAGAVALIYISRLS